MPTMSTLVTDMIMITEGLGVTFRQRILQPEIIASDIHRVPFRRNQGWLRI